MSKTFPIGTIVYLKSGSPAMTVTEFGDPSPPIVSVEWFDDVTLKRDAFHQESLISHEMLAKLTEDATDKYLANINKFVAVRYGNMGNGGDR